MTKKAKANARSLDANRLQGSSVAERETAAEWGGPNTSASPLPLDQHHTRRQYMGYGQLPQDARRQLAVPGDELERIVTNVSACQLVHGATRRGMPGKATYPGSGPQGKIRAVHRFGLEPAVHRVADAGHDPGSDQVNVDYLREPQGPRPDVLAKYVDAARHVPEPTGCGGQVIRAIMRPVFTGRSAMTSSPRSAEDSEDERSSCHRTIPAARRQC